MDEGLSPQAGMESPKTNKDRVGGDYPDPLLNSICTAELFGTLCCENSRSLGKASHIGGCQVSVGMILRFGCQDFSVWGSEGVV